MQVILLPEVLDYLEDLTIILYEKGYFSYGETAINYVLELYDDIVSHLPSHHQKLASKHFEKFGKGMKYASFRKNKQTTWYVFFNIYHNNGETIYLVRYISNNHVIAQYL